MSSGITEPSLDSVEVSRQKSLTELLDEKELRANAATPGPWYRDPTNDIGDWLVGSSTVPVADCDFAELTGQEIDGNAIFIAATRNDVPALVKLARRQREIIESLNQNGDYDEELAQLLREPADSVQDGNAVSEPPSNPE